MASTNLRTIEKKALGALLILSNDSLIVKESITTIATVMGYKVAGGAITTAIHSLVMKNFLTIIDKGVYQILL
jgi:hypothetical protein